MSFLTVADYRTWAGLSADATRDASLSAILSEVEDAFRRHVGRPFDQATYTRVLDGPPREELLLPFTPVSPTGLRVWVNDDARGDPDAFTDDAHELDRYTEWDVDIDQPDGTSKAGILRRVDGGIWAARVARRVGSLAGVIRPRPKCVKVTWLGGFASVPASVVGAGYLAASKILASRRLGGQVQSGSDNGASWSLAGSATADGVLGDPNIRDALRPFRDVFVAAGG